MNGLDEIFEALADNRRRLALYYLQKHRTLTLPDLAELIAEEEHGTKLSDLSGETVTDLYASLHHKHVPKLEAADLVLYEQEDDLITCADQISTALGNAKEEARRLQTV